MSYDGKIMDEAQEHVKDFQEQEKRWQGSHDLSLRYAAMGVSNLIEAWGYYFGSTPIIESPGHHSGVTYLIMYSTLQFAMVLLDMILCAVFLKMAVGAMTERKEVAPYKVWIITLGGPLARTLAMATSCECPCNGHKHLYRCACGDSWDHAHRCCVVLSAFFHFLWNALAVDGASVLRDAASSLKSVFGPRSTNRFGSPTSSASQPRSPRPLPEVASTCDEETPAIVEAAHTDVVQGTTSQESSQSKSDTKAGASPMVDESALRNGNGSPGASNHDVAGKTCGGLIVLGSWFVILTCSVPFIGFAEPETGSVFCARFYSAIHDGAVGPAPHADPIAASKPRPPWEEAAATGCASGLIPQVAPVVDLPVVWPDARFRPHAIACGEGRTFLSDEFNVFELKASSSGTFSLQLVECGTIGGLIADVAISCETMDDCHPLLLLSDPPDLVVHCPTGEHVPLMRGISGHARHIASRRGQANGTRLFTMHGGWAIEREYVGPTAALGGPSWRPIARVAQAEGGSVRSVAVTNSELWFFDREGTFEMQTYIPGPSSTARLMTANVHVILSACVEESSKSALLLVPGTSSSYAVGARIVRATL